jgi:CheY-like chemotaxis protein
MSRKKQILYAEDDENDALFMKRAFAQCGIAHELLIIAGGSRVMEYLHAATPDLIILDNEVPTRTGLEILRWIKQESRHLSKTPVIIFSSSPHAVDVLAAERLGALAYCVKPVNPHDLAAFVRSIGAYLDAPEPATTWQCPPGSTPPHLQKKGLTEGST